MVKKVLVLFTVIVLSVGVVACKSSTKSDTVKKHDNVQKEIPPLSKIEVIETSPNVSASLEPVEERDPRVTTKEINLTSYRHGFRATTNKAMMEARFDISIAAFQVKAKQFAYEKVSIDDSYSILMSGIIRQANTSGLWKVDRDIYIAKDGQCGVLITLNGDVTVEVPNTDVITEKTSGYFNKADIGLQVLFEQALTNAIAKTYPKKDNNNVSVQGLAFISDLLIEREGEILKMSATFSIAFDE